MKKHILAILAIALCVTAVFAADSIDVMLTKIFGQSKPPTAPPYALTSFALVDSPGSVRSVLTLTKANTATHDYVAIAEDTDFFVHYESGKDFLVTITDQSTKTAIGLVNHK